MNRFGLSLFILLAALVLWIPGRLNLLLARHALADAQASLADLHNRITTLESRLAAGKQERKIQNDERVQASAALSEAQRELARIDPESQWANPPVSLPDWHTDSPYFWTPKESLGGFDLKVFARDGSLSGEIASILAIDESTLRTLNEQLARAVADFLSFKRSTARVSNNPVNANKAYEMKALKDAMGREIESRIRSMQRSVFPDGSEATAPEPEKPAAVRKANGPMVTVVVPAQREQAARLREQITQILEQNLGSQRAKLLTQMGGDWLDEAWGHPGLFGVSITVMRHPDGTYMIGNHSTGGFADDVPASDVPQHIPDYLRPFFTDILSAAGDPGVR